RPSRARKSASSGTSARGSFKERKRLGLGQGVEIDVRLRGGILQDLRGHEAVERSVLLYDGIDRRLHVMGIDDPVLSAVVADRTAPGRQLEAELERLG